MSRRRADLPMLAGWLFADLFLLLLLAGLAVTPGAADDEQPPVSPSASASVKPPVRPSTPARAPGLDPDYVEFDVNVSPDRFRAGATAEVVRQVNAELKKKNPKNRRVGFVLVFASDDREHIQRANDTAADVVTLLQAKARLFAGAPGLGYWNGDNDNFEFKVFLMN